MATFLNRLEFKHRYPGISQGLFLLFKEKRIPKELPSRNVGQIASKAACSVPESQQADAIKSALADAISSDAAVSMTHIEILFSSTLKYDVVRFLLSISRNRKAFMALALLVSPIGLPALANFVLNRMDHILGFFEGLLC